MSLESDIKKKEKSGSELEERRKREGINVTCMRNVSSTRQRHASTLFFSFLFFVPLLSHLIFFQKRRKFSNFLFFRRHSLNNLILLVRGKRKKCEKEREIKGKKSLERKKKRKNSRNKKSRIEDGGRTHDGKYQAGK